MSKQSRAVALETTTSLTARTRLPRAQREQQLLDVAMRLFMENGYQGTSIEDIAGAAGVTRPIVYNHFGSKDGIYLACLRRASSELDRRIRDSSSQETTAEGQLRGGLDGYFQFVERDRMFWGILFGGGAAVAGTAAAEASRLRKESLGGISELLAGMSGNSLKPETLEAYAQATFGAGEQLAKWWLMHPDVKRHQVVEYMMNFAWQGLQQLAMFL